MYSKDFIEKMERLGVWLDEDGYVLYVNGHFIKGNYSDMINENYDNVLKYIKETYQRKKGIYELFFDDEILGFIVGHKNINQMVKTIVDLEVSRSDNNLINKMVFIEEQQNILEKMKILGESQDKIKEQENLISQIRSKLDSIWSKIEKRLTKNLRVKRIR